MAKAYVNQHVVPVCYLNRFAEKKQSGKYVIGTGCFINNEYKLFERNTSDVGYEKNIYDVYDKNDPKYWEHYLADKIDSLCDIKLGTILSSVMHLDAEYTLNENDRIILSKIVVAQSLRIPSNIDYVKDYIYPRVHSNLIRKIHQKLSKEEIDEYRSQIESSNMSDQEIKETYLNSSFDEKHFDNLVDNLCRRAWVIFVNDLSGENPFVTSDNPVLIQKANSLNRSGLFPNGLLDHNTCIFFPISPSIAVANYSTMGVFHKVSQFDGKVYFVKNPKFILEKNIAIIEQARKHFFVPKPLYDYLKTN